VEVAIAYLIFCSSYWSGGSLARNGYALGTFAWLYRTRCIL